MEGKQMSTKCDFSNDEISRYSRQLILPEIGVEGFYLLFYKLSDFSHLMRNNFLYVHK